MGDFQGPMGDFGFVPDTYAHAGNNGNFNGGLNSPQIPPGPQHIVNGELYLCMDYRSEIHIVCYDCKTRIFI